MQRNLEEPLRRPDPSDGLTEKEKSRQGNIMDALLDNLSSGVFMVEAPSGKPLIANRMAKRLLGQGVLPDVTKDNLAEVYKAHKPQTHKPYPVDEMPIIQGMQGNITHVDDMIVERPDGTEWNRQSQREPKSAPLLFRTGTTRVVPVLHIATLFGYHHVSQWYT